MCELLQRVMLSSRQPPAVAMGCPTREGAIPRLRAFAAGGCGDTAGTLRGHSRDAAPAWENRPPFRARINLRPNTQYGLRFFFSPRSNKSMLLFKSNSFTIFIRFVNNLVNWVAVRALPRCRWRPGCALTHQPPTERWRRTLQPNQPEESSFAKLLLPPRSRYFVNVTSQKMSSVSRPHPALCPTEP